MRQHIAIPGRMLSSSGIRGNDEQTVFIGKVGQGVHTFQSTLCAPGMKQQKRLSLKGFTQWVRASDLPVVLTKIFQNVLVQRLIRLWHRLLLSMLMSCVKKITRTPLCYCVASDER